MRKFQQVVIAAAVAAGGLSAIGTGTAAADSYGSNGPERSDVYRPYQECSPQTVAENDIPLGVLGLAQTMDTTCGQYNGQYNSAFSG
ncbi:hypothetical protein ABT272_44275 [Streptomyces sp900105245]|uniref:Uncharacterized protein n=1 Tax=Streptomyces sp. 900105245 TaxID=3154379 RepID=A0ABV1ULY2_9ACTN